MLFMSSREVRTPASTARPQSVAQCTVDAELILTRLGRFGIAREGIAIVRSIACMSGQQQESGAD